MNATTHHGSGDDALPPRREVADSGADGTLPFHRPVRSFVVRGGRLGSGQARALAALAPRFVVPFQRAAFDDAAVFGRKAPLIVEIGFGMGQATAAYAQAHPSVNLLGIEVHPPGVGSLLQQIEALGLTNVRIVQHDAVEVFTSMLGDATLAAVHCFFPDPWPKKRHHKRRLIQPAFARLVTRKLAARGRLHLATDWEPYAEHMLAVLTATPGITNIAPSGGYVPRPESRALTKFEARGLGLGHGVRDLVFEKA